MDEQMQDHQLEPKYNCSVSIQDIVLKTSREGWTIETGGERVSGRSVVAVRHDDDDDDGGICKTHQYKNRNYKNKKES